MRLPLEDFLPGLGAHRTPRAPGAAKETAAGAIARPRSILQLLDKAEPNARPVLSVGPSDILIVVREMTPWILVAARRDGKMELGWTTRDQVSISH